MLVFRDYWIRQLHCLPSGSKLWLLSISSKDLRFLWESFRSVLLLWWIECHAARKCGPQGSAKSVQRDQLRPVPQHRRALTGWSVCALGLWPTRFSSRETCWSSLSPQRRPAPKGGAKGSTNKNSNSPRKLERQPLGCLFCLAHVLSHLESASLRLSRELFGVRSRLSKSTWTNPKRLS